MFKAVVILLFALFSLASCANFTFEGLYYWNGTEVWVCQNGTSISARFGRYGLVYATTSPAYNHEVAFGKYFYLGDLYTGVRVSFKRFTGGRGRLAMIYNTTTETLSAVVLPRDSTGLAVVEELFTDLVRNSTDVGTDRVYNCGILDRTADVNVAGKWNTSDSSEITGYYCLSNNTHGRPNSVLIGSYKFLFTYYYSHSILPGYVQGYCTANAQVCGVVYYQNDLTYETFTTFGAELIYRLSDDRLILSHTRGAPGITGFTTYNIGINSLDRVLSSSDLKPKKCTKYQDNYFKPTQCKKLSLDLCDVLSEYGFCQISDKQGSCIRTRFTAA